jgi:tetratricopeptide (TPR) repeat protein
MEQQAGGALFLGSAREDLRLITGMLANGRYTEAVGRRLYDLAAEVCCLLGWMSYDAGLNTAAQQHYTAGLRAAKSAGNDALGAHILCFMATQAANHLEQHAALRLMDAANSVRSRAGSALRASLDAHQTTVYSKAGDFRAAGAALHRAYKTLDQVHDAPAYLRWFGPAQLSSTEGRYRLISGSAEQAVEALTRAVREAAPRDQAVRYSTLALAHQQTGELDGALEATGHALDLIEQGIRTQRGVERLQDVSKGFRPFASSEPRVREAQMRVAAAA